MCYKKLVVYSTCRVLILCPSTCCVFFVALHFSVWSPGCREVHRRVGKFVSCCQEFFNGKNDSFEIVYFRYLSFTNKICFVLFFSKKCRPNEIVYFPLLLLFGRIMAPQEVKFMENRLGGVALVIDGCKYRINRRSGNTVYWRCFYRWCRANAVVEDGKLKSSCGSHICSQPHNNIQNGGASAKSGRHRQSSDHQQTPTVTQQQTVAVHQRPATSSSVQPGSRGAASLASKMATRAAQGSTTHTLTRNANKGKVALRSQKPPTNNNMVIRRKSKANEEDIKPTNLTVQPSTTTDSPQCVPDSPPNNQVR